MSDYNAGHTDRLAAERRDIDSHWESFHDKMARFRTMEAWSPPPMSDLGKQLFQVCQPSPQELDAIAKMEKDLLAKLERANKIDRLKAELTIKAEELRQAQLAEAYEGVEEQEMTEADSEAFLKQLHADKLAEEATEGRAFAPKLNPHDE